MCVALLLCAPQMHIAVSTVPMSALMRTQSYLSTQRMSLAQVACSALFLARSQTADIRKLFPSHQKLCNSIGLCILKKETILSYSRVQKKERKERLQGCCQRRVLPLLRA